MTVVYLMYHATSHCYIACYVLKLPMLCYIACYMKLTYNMVYDVHAMLHSYVT